MTARRLLLLVGVPLVPFLSSGDVMAPAGLRPVEPAARVSQTRGTAGATGAPRHLEGATADPCAAAGSLLGVVTDAADTRVRGVLPGSAAARAGVLRGDRLVAVGGRQVRSGADIRPALDQVSTGDPVALRVVRKGRLLEVTAVAGAPEAGRPHECAPHAAPAR